MAAARRRVGGGRVRGGSVRVVHGVVGIAAATKTAGAAGAAGTGAGAAAAATTTAAVPSRGELR